MRYLKSAGIQTSIHYPPVHRFSSYANLSTEETEGLSLTEDVAAREVTLPLFPTMTSHQTEMVCDVVREFFAQGDLTCLNYSTKKLVNIPACL
jgi:dTDP-4-amino-4,6-dideoxygalactose transaminase